MTLKTNKEIFMNFRGTDIVIPEGTLCTHMTAMGFDPNYTFIEDLSWISKDIEHIRHDAKYYGIQVSDEDVTEY